jgi:hypothetical protein
MDRLDGGWIEVLAWPGLARLAALPGTSVASSVRFDPSGRYLLLPGTGSVLDVATGKQLQVVPDSIGFDGAAWDEAGNLLMQAWSSDTPTLLGTYDLQGKLLSRRTAEGNTLVGTPDGKTAVTYHQQRSQAPAMTVIRNGDSHDVALPGPLLWGPPALSPDGTAMVVVCSVNGVGQILLGSI